jgi:hypothetical protein
MLNLGMASTDLCAWYTLPKSRSLSLFVLLASSINTIVALESVEICNSLKLAQPISSSGIWVCPNSGLHLMPLSLHYRGNGLLLVALLSVFLVVVVIVVST